MQNYPRLFNDCRNDWSWMRWGGCGGSERGVHLWCLNVVNELAILGFGFELDKRRRTGTDILNYSALSGTDWGKWGVKSNLKGLENNLFIHFSLINTIAISYCDVILTRWCFCSETQIFHFYADALLSCSYLKVVVPLGH